MGESSIFDASHLSCPVGNTQASIIMNQLDPTLIRILDDLANGQNSVETTAKLIAESSKCSSAEDESAITQSVAFSQLTAIEGAVVDLGRQARCGFGEVIFGEGKSTELIARIIQAQLDAGQSAFVTRIDPTAAAQIRRQFNCTHHNPMARTMRIAADHESLNMPACEDETPHVAVVTAGSTDVGVAEEAAETLAWMKVPCRRFEDIGVAGPQRLIAAIPRLRKASAIVVIAGMEGALPAAVAGHVASMVIAVPTSSGYGANFNGLTPLMGMLTSCAANVAVVNIDAGFKGGYLAGLIASGIASAQTTASAVDSH